MLRSRLRFAITCVWVVLAAGGLLAAPAAAQAPRPMSIVDLLTVPQLTDPRLSPDGRQVLYVLAQPDWKANKRVRHIWRVNADGSDTVQMTSGNQGEEEPRWSPDGRTIAFLAARGEADRTQIYLVPNSGGEGRPLTDHDTSVSHIAWAPDGGSVYFLARDPKSAAQKAREKAKDDVFAFDEDYEQQHLWRVTVADRIERRLTSGDSSVNSYHVSRDGTKIAFEKAPNPLLGYAERGEAWVMDSGGSGAVQLTRNTVAEEKSELSPDNSQVLFLAQANQRFEPYYNTRIFVQVATGGGEARAIAPGFPYEVEEAAWSRDGRSILFLANMGVHTELFTVDAANGDPRQLTDGQHAIKSVSYAPALERLAFTVDEPANPGDVWTLAPGGAPQRVTHVFDYLSRDFKLAHLEKIAWKGVDGVPVEGLLYYPIDYRPGQRYPLAVQSHGGPESSDKFGFGSWNTYPQVLAGKGYAVLKTNYRGSTGYGEAFLRDMVGHYFQNAHLDVMAGVDRVIELGVADPDRLVKMGWSAGGHMTNKIITFTDRFKAASSGAGAADWVAMYAQSDIRSYRTPWFGGTPWQRNAPIDVYWNHSPLKYVANVRTPTIFLVGQQDPRVPMPQSVEMYRALLANGVPTHLYVAPREPHGWQEIRHQLFKINVELGWFEKYATKRPYVWEKAPGDTSPADPTSSSSP